MLLALTLPMLRLLWSKDAKIFENHPCPADTHWIALAGCSHMSTHVPGFQSFLRGFFHYFVLAKLTASSIRVKELSCLHHPHCLKSNPG